MTDLKGTSLRYTEKKNATKNRWSPKEMRKPDRLPVPSRNSGAKILVFVGYQYRLHKDWKIIKKNIHLLHTVLVPSCSNDAVCVFFVWKSAIQKKHVCVTPQLFGVAGSNRKCHYPNKIQQGPSVNNSQPKQRLTVAVAVDWRTNGTLHLN